MNKNCILRNHINISLPLIELYYLMILEGLGLYVCFSQTNLILWTTMPIFLFNLRNYNIISSVLARISKGQGATSEKGTFMRKPWLKKGTLMRKD